MLSREARIAVVTAKAARKYGPAIREAALVLEELIALMAAVDPVPKRKAWPPRMLAYLFHGQDGVCPLCNEPLPKLGEQRQHIDHVVPWAQGGDNARENIRLVHVRCNLLKSDECSPDDVIRYLESRLLNLRR